MSISKELQWWWSSKGPNYRIDSFSTNRWRWVKIICQQGRESSSRISCAKIRVNRPLWLQQSWIEISQQRSISKCTSIQQSLSKSEAPLLIWERTYQASLNNNRKQHYNKGHTLIKSLISLLRELLAGINTVLNQLLSKRSGHLFHLQMQILYRPWSKLSTSLRMKLHLSLMVKAIGGRKHISTYHSL